MATRSKKTGTGKEKPANKRDLSASDSSGEEEDKTSNSFEFMDKQMEKVSFFS